MMRRRIAWRTTLQWIGLWAALLAAPVALAAEPARSIAVIYPEIGEPFRSVFARIICA